jgi:hypothetical protein
VDLGVPRSSRGGGTNRINELARRAALQGEWKRDFASHLPSACATTSFSSMSQCRGSSAAARSFPRWRGTHLIRAGVAGSWSAVATQRDRRPAATLKRLTKDPNAGAGSGRGARKLTKSKLNIICCRNHSLEVCNSHRAAGGPTRWSQSDAMASYCHPDFIDWPRSCYQQASRVCSGRSRLQSPPAHSILLSGPRPLSRSVELWRHAPLWVLPFA